MRSLQEMITALQHKKISAVELVQHHLQQIQHHKHLNAFISTDTDYALQQAQLADQLLHRGEGRPLTGIPMAHKDIFCTTRLPTTCASKMLADFQSPYQATLANQLENAGTIMLGKTNMDEFAMGSANENSYFGPVKNPWDHTRVPGGSSGGSAAAVAAGLVPFATGSDTGGSIRQPAAFCGISGIKPTYGRVSRYGMIAFASSLDQAGAFAKSAEDLAIVLQAMAGFDPKDSTSASQVVPNYTTLINQLNKPMRIGLPRCFLDSQADPEIQEIVQEALKVFVKAGAAIVEIDFIHQPAWVPCYYVIACAEASSNLSRYDGIRYGYRSTNKKTIQELITASRTEGFGEEVKRRILTGTHVLSSGYFDAYYLQALKIRRLIRDEFISAFQQVDAILGPTTPTTAFKLEEKMTDPIKHYLADVFTVGANLAGLPALSIPAGFSQGLPVGLQLIGNYFNEGQLLSIAHTFQQVTDWHQRTPEGCNYDL